MFGYSQLSTAGLPQAAVLPIIAAIGISAGAGSAAATAEGGLVISEAVGASQGTATVTGVGGPRAAAQGEVIGRAVVYDAVSAPIAASVASASGIATVVAYERFETTALGAYALPVPYFEVQDKAVLTQRVWQETEFAYLNVTIGDITSFEFDITEIASFASDETAAFGGSTGTGTASSAAAAIGAPISAGVGASAGSATNVADGYTIATMSGAGASAGVAVADFRSVGTTLGLGVARSTAVAETSAIGISTAEAAGISSGTEGPGSFAGATGQAFVEAVGTSAGAATADGTPSTGSVAASAGTSTVAGIGISTNAAVFSSDGTSTGVFVGSGGISGDLHQMILVPRTGQIKLVPTSSRILLRNVA
jgi:hypothetical protein